MNHKRNYDIILGIWTLEFQWTFNEVGLISAHKQYSHLFFNETKKIEILSTLNIKKTISNLYYNFHDLFVSNDYSTTPITRSIEIIHLEGLTDTRRNWTESINLHPRAHVPLSWISFSL